MQKAWGKITHARYFGCTLLLEILIDLGILYLLFIVPVVPLAFVCVCVYFRIYYIMLHIINTHVFVHPN